MAGLNRVRGADPGVDEASLGPAGDPEQVARIICLRMLERRAYTRSELATALGKRGVPDDAAQQVLSRFAAVGLIDDAALADGFAVSQHHERGLAGRAVAHRLRQRGIGDDEVQAAIAQIDPESERAAAHALAERRLRSLGGVPPAAQARRLAGLLARKGYAPGLVYEVVREVLRGAIEVPDETDPTG